MQQSKINALRGTQDLWGDEAKSWEKVEARSIEVFECFGYQPIRTPLIESTSLFSRSIGSQTDIIQKEMYSFLDRSKNQISLRPEATASVVRAYVEHHLDKKGAGSKFYYSGPMFRGERPQAGRLRQFHQMGVETLGVTHPYADVETILCLNSLLKHLGIEGAKLKLNNLGSFEERAKYESALRKYFQPHRKDLCQDCQERLSKNVFRILDCKEENCRRAADSSPVILDFVSKKDQEHFDTVTSLLKSLGVNFEINPRIVRGLDYYTRTVFEVTHPDLGSKDALLAGGRYDALIVELGGESPGAVGFALGVERLLMILKAKGKNFKDSSVSVFIVALGDRAYQEAFSIAQLLRESCVPTHMDLEAKSLKAQLRQADRVNARFCLIIGEDEIEKGKAVLRNMFESTQEEVLLDHCLEEIKKRIG